MRRQTDIHMTCSIIGDPSFTFIATTHENTDGSLCIHGNDLDCTIYMLLGQAEQLIEELQKAIINLKVHKQITSKE